MEKNAQTPEILMNSKRILLELLTFLSLEKPGITELFGPLNDFWNETRKVLAFWEFGNTNAVFCIFTFLWSEFI